MAASMDRAQRLPVLVVLATRLGGGVVTGLVVIGLTATGLVAIGLTATGLVAIGLTATGLVVIGLTATGLVVIGLTATGLVVIGLIPTGLVVIGLTPTGLVVIGLIPTGLVVIGLIPTGLVVTGLTPTGLVMTGRPPGVGLLGLVGRLPTGPPDQGLGLPPPVLGSEPGPETATQSQTRSVWQFDSFPPLPGAAVQTYSFFHAHWYFVGPVRGWADAACGMNCTAPTTAKHISDKRPRWFQDLRGVDVVSSGGVMWITDLMFARLGLIDSRIAVITISVDAGHAGLSPHTSTAGSAPMPTITRSARSASSDRRGFR
jgi:hypothetical protein